MTAFDPWQGSSLLATMIRLSNERDMSWRRTKKGDKRPWQDVEASKAGQKRRRTRLREAALAKIPTHGSTARPAGQAIADRMLQAMQPGEWYGAGDLARMVGESRSARGKVSQVMIKRGWVEAAQNGAWSDAKPNPWEIMAGAEPHPKTLYRLTEEGALLRSTREPG